MLEDRNSGITTTRIYDDLRTQVAAVVAENVSLREENHKLRDDNQILRDEIARLKGQKGKPVMRPSQLTPPQPSKGRPGKQHGAGGKRQIDRVDVIRAENVPAGSRFKGYRKFDVQELLIKSEVVRYKVEQWQTPEGKLLTGKLPTTATVDGGHFGTDLVCFVLYQYYHAMVTEPLLLEQLREFGIRISSGQLHRLLTEGKERFHQEKLEILQVGLRVSKQIHVDDTGARHQGNNGYCTHIGNAWFAWFESTSSKSRINFLKLLHSGYQDLILNDVALRSMATQKLPQRILERLQAAISDDQMVFADEAAWQAALQRWAITQPRHVQIATAGALLGAIVAHGIHPDLAIVSDDAGQFNVLLHSLCWIHAERVLAKLIGVNEEQQTALDQARTDLWQLYRQLQAYKTHPTADERIVIEQAFDALCAQQTCFASLNEALQRMARNKAELLLVLDRPDLDLHNNLSEGDIREYVKRRKISGGTRSEEGRRCRDTFASLKKTCRKLRVSFWNFLTDRLAGGNGIPPLPTLITARAQSQ